MHYKNGREAKEGDPVVGKAYTGGGEKVVAGVITELNAKAQTCNGVLVYPTVGGTGRAATTIGELLHAEDAFDSVLKDLAAKEAPPAVDPNPEATGGGGN